MSGLRSWSNGEWVVQTNKSAISDSNEIDSFEEKLSIPMPEMVFGSNMLRIEHLPSNFKLEFNTYSALDGVDKTYGSKTKILKVAHSDEWKASKIKVKKEHPVPTGQIDYDVNRIHRPFDWTYTTDYQGDVLHPQTFNQGDAKIPYDQLKLPDPILFFDEVQLYEDELGDFGLATYSVKIRVMPHNLFVLARLYLRVDHVAFRVRDTRIYVDFRNKKVVKEYTEKEETYETVKKQVPIWAEDFTQMLRDHNWVDNAMSPIKTELTQIDIP